MNKPLGRRNLPTILQSFGRHLVYAEGSKTEHLYVRDLRLFISEELAVKESDIEIIPVPTNKSKHTLDLVNFAKSDVEKRRKKDETIDYVWIFYDKDDFLDFDKAYKTIILLNDKDGDIDGFGTSWKACWSNECFEVWIYHYFENLQSQISRDQYIKKINAFLKRNGSKENYSKTRDDIHHFLTSFGGNIKLATKLMKSKDVKTDIKPNPSSGIYQFAEYLLAYIDNKSNIVK